MSSLSEIAGYFYGEDVSKAMSAEEKKLLEDPEYRRFLLSGPHARRYTKTSGRNERFMERARQGLKEGALWGGVGAAAGAAGGALYGRTNRSKHMFTAKGRKKVLPALGALGVGAWGLETGMNVGSQRAAREQFRRGDYRAYDRKTGKRAKDYDLWTGKLKY